MTGVKLRDYGCMLRAYRREVIELLDQCGEANKFITALVSWLGVSIAEVDVFHEARSAGKSKYSYLKLLRMNFDLITGFSILPIQFVSLVGFLLAVVGFAAGFFLLAWRLVYGSGPTGLTSFLAVLFVLFGIQLMALGLIGEYVARTFIGVQGRPYYLVKEIIGGNTGPSGGHADSLEADGRPQPGATAEESSLPARPGHG